MQLHNVPVLGVLAPDAPASRREKLARDGAQAEREIAGLLSRARSRARTLAIFRVVWLLAAGVLLALLAGALLASLNGATLARVVAAVLAAGLAVAAGPLLLPRPVAPPRVGRGPGGAPGILSSGGVSAPPPPGAAPPLFFLF